MEGWPLSEKKRIETKQNINHITLKINMEKFIRNISLCLLLLLGSGASLMAQERYQLRGQVVESDGTPLLGASVFVKGQPTNGAVADING